MEQVVDIPQLSREEDATAMQEIFQHKTFQERLAEYDGDIFVCDYDWGEPMGKELL